MLFCGNVTGFPAEEKILRAGCVSGHIIGDGKMGIISYIKEEIQVIRERDPAIKSNMEVLLYPSFKVILRYRLAHKLYLKKHYFLARWISQRAARKTGIEIHPGATIGKGLFIDQAPRSSDPSRSERTPRSVQALSSSRKCLPTVLSWAFREGSCAERIKRCPAAIWIRCICPILCSAIFGNCRKRTAGFTRNLRI